MASKKHLNMLIEFKIKGRKNVIKGILINYSDEWTLLVNNPVDYILDGFIIIRNKGIVGFNDHEKSFENKILKKKAGKLKEVHLNIESQNSLLFDLKDKKSIISIETVKNKSFLLGRIMRINEKQNTILVKPLSPEAKWEQNENIAIADISIIEFSNDYIQSLLLVARTLR